MRTTPFTCGCQASVAINIRIKGTRERVILDFPTLFYGYFRRVTSHWLRDSFLGSIGSFRPPRHKDETFPYPDETILRS
ncbi:MAG TPA: hypothetical protein VN065_15310 [Bradyrhizobium sp.]|nr:hypothetical protein [Bradyrhizobium sp.]